MFWLEALPLEIMALISLHMDPWALRSLLKASRRIRAHFIVLVKEPFDPLRTTKPRFFKVPQLRCLSRLQFNPQTTGAIIKIYEVLVTEMSKDSKLVLNHISPLDSYVFFQDAGSDSDFVLWKDDETVWDGKHVRYWRGHCLDSRYKKQLYTRAPAHRIVIGALRQLELDDVTCACDLELDCVVSLTLVFADPSDGSRPEFSRVKAPELRSIALFYNDTPPIVRDIELKKYSPCFETLTICHIPSQRGGLNSPLPVYSASVDDLDFSTICNWGSFTNTTVIGGHNAIVSQLLLGTTSRFYWKQTCRQIGPPVVVLPKSPTLSFLVFESLLPDAIVPSCTSPYLGKLIVVGYDGLKNVVPPEKSFYHKLIIHCGGERSEREVPSLSMFRQLLRGLEGPVSFLSLHGFSKVKAGDGPESEQFVQELLDGRLCRRTDIQNLI